MKIKVVVIGICGLFVGVTQGYDVVSVFEFGSNPYGVDSAGAPAVNDNGDLAFQGWDSNGDRNIYRLGSDGVLTAIANEQDGYTQFGGGFSLIRKPVINNSGTVAFFSYYYESSPWDILAGIFAGSGGTPCVCALTTMEPVEGVFFSVWSHPSLNESDQIAFTAQYTVDDPYAMGVSAVYKGAICSGPTPGGYEVVRDSATMPNVSEFYDVDMNDSGQVAYTAWDSGLNVDVLYFFDGTDTHEYAAVVPGLVQFSSAVHLNNNGQIAISAYLESGEYVIVVVDDGVAEIVAETSGSFSFDYQEFGFTDEGEIVMIGEVEMGSSGTATQMLTLDSAGAMAPILSLRDEVFGDELAGFSLVDDGVSPGGMVAFSYSLDNGVEGIARVSLHESGADCDADDDGDVDLRDFAAFQVCYVESPSLECLGWFDDDGDLELTLDDYAHFESVLGSP